MRLTLLTLLGIGACTPTPASTTSPASEGTFAAIVAPDSAVFLFPVPPRASWPTQHRDAAERAGVAYALAARWDLRPSAGAHHDRGVAIALDHGDWPPPRPAHTTLAALLSHAGRRRMEYAEVGDLPAEIVVDESALRFDIPTPTLVRLILARSAVLDSLWLVRPDSARLTVHFAAIDTAYARTVPIRYVKPR